MRIAVITANIGDIDGDFNVIEQTVNNNITLKYFCYNEKSIPFPFPNLNNRLKSRFIKIKTHEFLPNFDYYLWLDCRIEVIDKNFIQNIVNDIKDYDICLVKHEERKDVFEELNFILDFVNQENKYLGQRYYNQKLEEEFSFLNKNNIDNKLKDIGLFASGIFLRKNNENTNKAFDLWWDLCIKYSYFDQAVLSYVIMKSNLLYKIFKWNDLFDKFLNLGKHRLFPINMIEDDVFYKIKYHLINKIPMSLCRYGDGEAMLLDKEDASLEYKDFVFKRQLGNSVSDIQKKEIIENLIYAYNNADVIGRPTLKHDKKDNYWKIGNEILSQYINLNKDSCSIDVFYDFLNTDKFYKLLNNRKKIFYINSSNLDDKFKDIFKIEEINSFIIAPEIKFDPDYNGKNHYPDQYNEVKKWINTLDCEGCLCLVGAGVVGKIYNIWFKEKGGISLDIGGVFDAWAGKNTRGEGRGVGVVDNTYKL